MSPMTGKPLPSKQVVPNLVLKQLIQQNVKDLPPLDDVVSAFSVLSVYLVEAMFGFLDARSLGRVQTSCADFLAVGSQQRLWTPLLSLDFPSTANSEMHEGDQKQQNPAQHYKTLRNKQHDSGKTAKPAAPTSSTGLHLYAAPEKSKTKQ